MPEISNPTILEFTAASAINFSLLSLKLVKAMLLLPSSNWKRVPNLGLFFI